MMKQLKCLLIATLFFLGANQIFAQSKTAHVDANEIFDKMPAVIEAKKQLEKLKSDNETDTKNLIEAYQKMVNQYENEVSKVSEKINGERQKEVQDFQKRIQEFRQDNDDKFQKKQAELINPIQVKVLAAIQKVGKAKGFQYVLNSESLLLADGPNLTADVKKELGF